MQTTLNTANTADPCIGCYCFMKSDKTKLTLGLFCVATPYLDKKICPCLECLVKGICRDACKDYFKYGRFVKKRKEITNE